jgi:hypothetical protein
MREMFVNPVAGLERRGLLRDTTHLSVGQGFRLIVDAEYPVLTVTG